MKPAELSDQEAFAFLGNLFPGGLKDAVLIAELCPEGWEKSPLYACYHPAPEVVYREHIAFTRNLRSLFPRKRETVAGEVALTPEEPERTFAEFLAAHPPDDTPPSAEAAIHEPAELLGLCLWDVFSDNHDVIAADGRIVHLGSFRGSAGMISDFSQGTAGGENDGEDWWSDRGEGYMDFYMGTSWVARRADLTPVYRLIFRRLKSLGADWRYSFPRIHIIDFGSREDDDSLPYDPSAALQREADGRKRAAETARMRKQLDRDARTAMRKARTGPPPSTVRAYQEVYGKFPQGWPPDPYDKYDS